MGCLPTRKIKLLESLCKFVTISLVNAPVTGLLTTTVNHVIAILLCASDGIAPNIYLSFIN